MIKKLTLFLACLFLSIGIVNAQTRVTGTVTAEEDGLPIVGASIHVLDTQVGTATDVDGTFTLNVPSGKTMLRVSYIGMVTQDLPIAPNMNIVLKAADTKLDEVVVTALGISRQEKTLGYAATTVKADELVKGHMSNVTSSLAGKVAGVQVKSSGNDPGMANDVIIRGISSINGSNQPLYVIDGVPLQNTTFRNGDQDYMNALGGISNVNSNDIESMTVLKGAAATAIYGSRAANGAIIITTKKGARGVDKNFTITYDGSVQFKRVSTLPMFQNKYGQGWNGTQTFIENGSWGPEMDGSMQVVGPIYDHQQLLHKYSPVENNIRDFFDTGILHSHNVAFSGLSGDGKMSYYLSYGFTSDDGIIPDDHDTFKRNTLAFRGSYDAAKWLKVSSSVNFSKSNTNTVASNQGATMIDGLYEFPRDLSLVDHQDLSSPFNQPAAWYTPYGITNPYWAIANNYNHNDSKQIFGNLQADIKPIDKLTLTYRFGFDHTDYDVKIGKPQIGLDDALVNEDYGYAPSEMNEAGYVYSRYYRGYEYNHDFLANFKDKYVGGRLDLDVNVGVNINERALTAMIGQTDDLTFYSGFWDLSNGATKTTLTESQSKRRLVGLFGDVTLGWDDMLFLELTGRNDWSSTLPLEKNSFFYPGATLSWIFTKVIPQNDVLNFGKLRLAYGKTGNDAGVYLINPSFVQAYTNGYYGSDLTSFPHNGVNAFQASSTFGSKDLKPEMTTEFEAGLNLHFFQSRIAIDAAFYNRETKDQIFTLPVDPAIGYSYMVTNFGNVRNRGIELMVDLVPVRTADFKWNIGFNFAKNWNKVVSMPASLEGGRTTINRFSAGDDAVYMYAEEGKPIGELYTYLPQYTADGKIIVDANGQPVLSTAVEDTGKSVNADWTGGVTTSLSYKWITLSAALDIRQGGYMFTRTRNLMQFTGNGKITTYNDRNPFIIPNSVHADGSENTTPIYLYNSSYQDYFNKKGYSLGGEAYLQDRSFVKLRNITLAFQLPKRWVNSIYLSDASISLFCNNVFTWTAKDNYYIDPEAGSYGNDLYGAFGELYANPACRTFGVNLSLKF